MTATRVLSISPDPEKKEDFLHGLIAMRHMHIRALSETGLSAADEMLYPENWGYVSDILSYVAIRRPQRRGSAAPSDG